MFFGRSRAAAKGAARKAIHSILVVEDEPLVAFDTEHALEQAGFRIAATVEDYDHAVAVIESGGVDLIVADVRLNGDKTGIDLARHAVAHGLPVLFVTGACPSHARDLAVGCLAKPYAPRDLVGAIHLVDAVLGGGPRPRAPEGFHLFADAR